MVSLLCWELYFSLVNIFNTLLDSNDIRYNKIKAIIRFFGRVLHFFLRNVSFHQYFEFLSSIENILEYLSDDKKTCTFPILPKLNKRKLDVRKKYFSIFIQFISQDICANALFVSNIGIIISYYCKMSFYSIVVSFLFPLQK